MKFDIDTQRGVAFLFGLIGLLMEGIAYSFLGTKPSDLLTGACVSLAIGPVLTSTIEKYRDKKGNGKGNGNGSGGGSNTPELEPDDDGEPEDEDEFKAKWGYVPCMAS